MRTIRVLRTAALLSLALTGPWFAGGCGESESTENGKMLVEDPKVSADRSKMIQDMYKADKSLKGAQQKK